METSALLQRFTHSLGRVNPILALILHILHNVVWLIIPAPFNWLVGVFLFFGSIAVAYGVGAQMPFDDNPCIVSSYWLDDVESDEALKPSETLSSEEIEQIYHLSRARAEETILDLVRFYNLPTSNRRATDAPLS